MKKRYNNLDLLKFLSCIMIITFHYLWNGNYSWELFSLKKRLVIDPIYLFGEIGVNCFILISGFFMYKQNSKLQLKKLVLIWLQLLFYSVFAYAVLYIKNPHQITGTEIFRMLTPLTTNTWWYATAYVLLCAFSPYLNRMLFALSKKEFQEFLAVFMIIYCIYPTVMGFTNGNPEKFLYYSRFIWMIGLYCVGAYIKQYLTDQAKSVRKKYLIMFAASWAMVLAFSTWRELYPNMLFSNELVKPNYFWPPNTILMVLISYSLFMIFLYTDIKDSKIIPFLASNSLGIYLIHGGISNKMWWNSVFHNPAYSDSKMVFVDWFCAILTIACAGIVVDTVRKQLEKYIARPLVEAVEKSLTKNS